MSETVVLKVNMSCQGCVGAVNRVLSKMEGGSAGFVSNDIWKLLKPLGPKKEQKVTVKGNVKPESVLQTVSKTGKATSFWEATEAKPEPVPKPNVPQAKPEPVSKPNDPKPTAEPGSKSTDAVAAA